MEKMNYSVKFWDKIANKYSKQTIADEASYQKKDYQRKKEQNMYHKTMIFLSSAFALNLLLFLFIPSPVRSASKLLEEDSRAKTFLVTSTTETEPSILQRNHEAYQERIQQWRENQRDQNQKYQNLRREQQEQFQRREELRRQQQEQIVPPEEVINRSKRTNS
jgi:hypothetical protein